MRRRTRWPLALSGGLAALTGVLAVLTLVVPDWIEAIFGPDPDGGNGSAEAAVVIVLAVACIALAVATDLLWRAVRGTANEQVSAARRRRVVTPSA